MPVCYLLALRRGGLRKRQQAHAIIPLALERSDHLNWLGTFVRKSICWFYVCVRPIYHEVEVSFVSMVTVNQFCLSGYYNIVYDLATVIQLRKFYVSVCPIFVGVAPRSDCYPYDVTPKRTFRSWGVGRIKLCLSEQ